MSTLPPAVPPAAALLERPWPRAFAPPLAEPLTDALELRLPPAVVLDVVLVFCDAVVLWLVVARGAIVTLLWGIALKLASVFTVVLAFGLTAWPAVVLVSLLARLRPLPLPPPAAVLLVVAVFCDAAVVWLVVALGAMVTLLWGIALKVASVLTVVLALGLTAWPAVVLVVLSARFCAAASPLIAARTAAAMNVNCFRNIRKSPRQN